MNKRRNKIDSTTTKNKNIKNIVIKCVKVLFILLFVTAVVACAINFHPSVTQTIKKVITHLSVTIIVVLGIYFIFKISLKISAKIKIKINNNNSDKHKSISDKVNELIKSEKSTSPKSYSYKYLRQKATVPEKKVTKQNTQKVESIRLPIQKDEQGFYCTLNKGQLHKIRIKNEIKIYLLPKNEINDIDGYTVKINIIIKDKYIKSAVLFFDNKFAEELQVANKTILQK